MVQSWDVSSICWNGTISVSIIHIGCCGWSYLREQEFAGKLTTDYSSTLQAYAQLFDVVEINSTFYRIPRLTTAQKWRKDALEINKGFEFTVKAYQGITHLYRFAKKSQLQFEQVKLIAMSLKAKVFLFQSPASFKPTSQNIKKLKTFCSAVERRGFVLVWEPRGEWYNEESTIVEVCEECNLVHCVDPFRNQPLWFGKSSIAYFRLHGFGKPSMYNYDFSEQELRDLQSVITSLPKSLKVVYVFFNNASCYRNGLDFVAMMHAV
jgi:uncharacterized protein YecE (DUF72 family)